MSYETDVFKFNDGLRFLNKDANQNERDNYTQWWTEQIELYGTQVDYYTNNYALSSHDFLYGEEPTQKYSDPKKVIFALTLNENAVVLGKFGLIADDEITAFISISSYGATFGPDSEPKSGDVFDLEEFGKDRPNSRGGKKFEITERLDQDVNAVNPILGHYVWLIKAKRFDFSYEPGISGEPASNQVYDDSFAGRISGGENPVTEDKAYNDAVDNASKDVFDYSLYGNNDDVYGDYR
jgi:hypothetical protein